MRTPPTALLSTTGSTSAHLTQIPHEAKHRLFKRHLKKQKNNLSSVRDMLTWSSRSHGFFTDRSDAIVSTNSSHLFPLNMFSNCKPTVLHSRLSKCCTSPPSQRIESKELPSPMLNFTSGAGDGTMSNIFFILNSKELGTGAAMLFLPTFPPLSRHPPLS